MKESVGDTMIKNLLIDYEKLLHKKFIIGLEGSQTLEFEFENINFMHLIGLHKLDDISSIQKFKDKNNKIYNAKKIYDDIKNGIITVDELFKSSKIDMIMESRLKYFSAETIMRLLHSEDVIKFSPFKVQFKNGENTKLEKIDYIFFETIEISKENYLQFCIGFDNKNITNHPSTFFMEKSNLYIHNQIRKKVVSLYIKSKESIDFKIFWHNVRLSMKKNIHYKWLEKKGIIYDFDIDDLNTKAIYKKGIKPDELNDIIRQFELLRLDEIKMVYLPYITDADKWNNEQKKHLVNYIDSLENKNVIPSLIQQELDNFFKKVLI